MGATIEPTTPGWYASADPRLRTWMIFRLSADTADGSLQWYAVAGNGESTPCDWEYIAQAGPVASLVRGEEVSA